LLASFRQTGADMSYRSVRRRLISLLSWRFHHKCTVQLRPVDQLGGTCRRTTGVVRGSALEAGVGTPIVYKLRRHRLTVSFTQLDQNNPKALFALGSQVRAFELQEFVDLWLLMVKVWRKAVDAHLVLTRSSPRAKKNRTPTTFGLKKRTLTITFTHLGRKKKEVFVALGTGVRMFRFEEFIDFWLDMVELVPNVVQVHSTYLNELAKQGRERSLGGQHICTLQ